MAIEVQFKIVTIHYFFPYFFPEKKLTLRIIENIKELLIDFSGWIQNRF